MKDNGPTLNDICVLVGTYLRLSKAYDKKWHPPSRFKTIGTQEERDRRMLEDLDRAYGENSPFVREQTSRTTASGRVPLLPAPAERVPPGPPLVTPKPQPPPKSDVVSIPLIRLPNGLLGCDWNKARPI